ncbi:MAG TPA: uroporphyrinogen-III synthase [Chloroflexota bacterium]|nr:uroporphyrinogen-III synthase [Chloroflexota bacterium]
MRRPVGIVPGMRTEQSGGSAVPGVPVERSSGIVPGAHARQRPFLVLNTRPREQAAELSGLLRLAGFNVLEAPAIEPLPAWDPSELAAVRRALAAGAYAWVVLPSQNAGRRLREELTGARVVCGAGSARALGLTATLTLDRYSASAALEALRPLVQAGQRILVPRAAESRDELTDGLLALGADVHAPIAYRTLAVDPSTLAEARGRLERGEVAVVTACSPSAIQSLLAAFGHALLLTTRLICFGATTAASARQAGLRVDGIAARTTIAALVDAVRAANTRAHPTEVLSTRSPLPTGDPSREGATGESARGGMRRDDEGDLTGMPI